MVKSFKGFRFDPELYAKFKELAAASNLMVTEAFERFMKACVDAGAVTFPEAADQSRRVEAEARVLLAWLRRGEYWYEIEGEKELSVMGRLLTLLGRIEDKGLQREIEEELKKR